MHYSLFVVNNSETVLAQIDRTFKDLPFGVRHIVIEGPP